MVRYLLILLLIFCASTLFAESGKKKMSYSELMQMDLDKSFPIINSLNKEEAKELITKIRSESRDSCKEVDKLYLLISQVEKISAIQEEQSRLRSLHLVYSLVLVLFVLVMGYVFYGQRKTIQSINELMK